MTTFEDIVSGAAAGTGVAGTIAVAVGAETLGVAAAAVAGALSSTGVGAAAVAVGAAVAGLVALIDASSDDAKSGVSIFGRSAPVPMVEKRDACGPRLLPIYRAVGDIDARLGWEHQPHPIPSKEGRDRVYAIRRMREDGLPHSEIHRWVAGECRRDGNRLGEANALVQMGIAKRAEEQAIAAAGRGPFALTYVRLLRAGCSRSVAIRRAMERDTDKNGPMGSSTLARRGALLDPAAWECREKAMRARFGISHSLAVSGGNITGRAGDQKGSTVFQRYDRSTQILQPTRPQFMSFAGPTAFTGSGEQRALDPREATTTQLAIGAGGGAVGALVGYKVGKKRGGGKAAKKWAILGGVGLALAAYFGAHAAGV